MKNEPPNRMRWAVHFVYIAYRLINISVGGTIEHRLYFRFTPRLLSRESEKEWQGIH